jgi:site-specific DNA recombinase
MRVATYTRISTDEENQPYSLEAQATRLGAYIASQEGWELARRFEDKCSGATLERPELQRALREARARRFDVLLVYRVDRLARSVRGLAQILEDLDSAGVVFRSATEPFDTSTPAGRLMVQMLGVFAEFERATIIDRVVAGMERKAARGGWNGGKVPYGYVIDPATKGLVPREDEARLVPTIFRLYTDRRLGTREIAAWLNRHGHRTRSGDTWTYKTVLTILRNRSYLGEIFFRGAYHPSSHTPLVDAEVFEAAQVILTERGEDASRKRSNSTDYLLSGRVVICGHCGSPYLGAAAHGRSGRYRYYVCCGRHVGGTIKCGADRVPADALEQAILGALGSTFSQTDLLVRAIDTARTELHAARPDFEAELAQVATQMRKTEEAVQRYLLAFEAGTLPEAMCGERLRSLGDRLGELRNRQADLTAAAEDNPADDPWANVSVEQVQAEVTRLLDAQDDFTTRKAMLRVFVEEVRIESRDAIYPTFRIPADPVRQLVRVVEPGGIEPPTSCMPCKRSPS